MTRTILCIGLLAATLAARPAAAQTKPTKQEQDAINVVNMWNAAWATKDAEKVGAFMAEDCVFRGDPSEKELKHGRAAFVNEAKGLIAMISLTIKPVETHAVGGETGVVVLQRRVDSITINGRKMEVPLVAFFRVKDGKIQEWLDVPLVNLGPPPGGAPAAPGTPGAPGGPNGR